MGIPSWVWFVVAVVAIGLGIALLIADRARRTPNNKERRRWAGLRGWQFAESDRVLPTRWHRGALAQHNGGTATDVVAGSTFTADGRRQVYVLDLDVNGKTEAVVVGVRCRRATPVTVELWLPDVPVPQDSGLDLLGPVGSRYAFVVDVAAARRLVTPGMAETADAVGSDVTVVWLEEDWVLASLDPAAADPSRLEQLLRSLGDVADLVDPFEKDPNESDQRAELAERAEWQDEDESPEPVAEGEAADLPGGGDERDSAVAAEPAESTAESAVAEPASAVSTSSNGSEARDADAAGSDAAGSGTTASGAAASDAATSGAATSGSETSDSGTSGSGTSSSAASGNGSAGSARVDMEIDDTGAANTGAAGTAAAESETADSGASERSARS